MLITRLLRRPYKDKRFLKWGCHGNANDWHTHAWYFLVTIRRNIKTSQVPTLLNKMCNGRNVNNWTTQKFPIIYYVYIISVNNETEKCVNMHLLKTAKYEKCNLFIPSCCHLLASYRSLEDLCGYLESYKLCTYFK